MFRVVAHQSAAAARQYYAEGLKREDYYSQGQEVAGKWHGKAAKRLGLSGDVTPEAFAALVENRHPITGIQLTPRMNADRRVGYDLNFHAPKSLSIVQALTGDHRLVEAFRGAVVETMADLEERTGTRVRKGGARGNRVTGNLAWAEFVHFTSRPVGGVPDPHLHVHAFAFNCTYDSEERRWKAAEFHDIKKEAPYCEAAFHARLASKVGELGYAIRRSTSGWEIDGISRDVIERFSRRTAQIEEVAAKKGITDPKLKSELGAATRAGKRKGVTQEDLVSNWKSRLSPQELQDILALVQKKGLSTSRSEPREKMTAAKAIDEAIEKLFAKQSVVEQVRIVETALRYGAGQVLPERAWKELAKREMLVQQIGGQNHCTTIEILAEEVELINRVRNGRGTCPALRKRGLDLSQSQLSEEQQKAARHLLTSTDQVLMLRGAAGVGKTTLMKEVRNQIEAAGLKVYAFAPSASASRGTLREEGFQRADTVAHLLLNTKLHKEIRGQVIWVDEAGLLGAKEMLDLLKLAGSSTRIILTGDHGQHSPVARGDAFRLLLQFTGARIAEVTEIRRQEPAAYKKAVSALSKGDLATAFKRLDELGAIVEVADESARHGLLAQEFVSLSRQGRVPLVVSPTHAESGKVTEAIRAAMKQAGWLKGEKMVMQLHDLRWENPDKRMATNYQTGMVVQFNQHAKGIKRGEIFEVVGRDLSNRVRLKGLSGGEAILPLTHVDRFQVYEKRSLEVAKGEKVTITRNGASLDGRRLNNGDSYTLEKFKRNGNIVLSNGAELDTKLCHIKHGYCQTSHSSQSKTVRDVLVAQSTKSFLAASREQFYVSVSRGKESIKIFTDSRTGLQEAVGNSATRQSGVEFAGISTRELEKMSQEMNGKQWTAAVKSRIAEGQAQNQVRNLLKARRQTAAPAKDSATKWRDYVAMKKGLVGPDGKSRSKGLPSPESKKMGSYREGRAFLRPTELRDSIKDKVRPVKPLPEKPVKSNPAQATEKTAGKSGTFERMKQRVETATANLAKVINKHNARKQEAEKPMRAAKNMAPPVQAQAPTLGQKVKQALRSTVAQATRHALKQDVPKQAPPAATQPAPVKTKAQLPPPPPPVRRK